LVCKADFSIFIFYYYEKMSFMKRLILVLLALILLLTPSCDFMKSVNPFGKKKRQTEALQKQQEAYRVADSIRVANEQAAAAEKARQDELARIAEQEAVELTKYHVIVGSFLTPAYADDWLGHIKGLGYDAQLVEMNGGRWHLVSAKSFANLHDAWNSVGSIQENINGEAWVYKKE
jgi:cell division protein FtsN